MAEKSKWATSQQDSNQDQEALQENLFNNLKKQDL